jgi:hypothetical protein
MAKTLVVHAVRAMLHLSKEQTLNLITPSIAELFIASLGSVERW